MEPAELIRDPSDVVGGLRRAKSPEVNVLRLALLRLLQSGHKLRAIAKSVGVHENVESRPVIDRAEPKLSQLLMVRQRDEMPRGGSEIEKRGVRTSRVPIDEGGRPAGDVHGVPWAEVTVTDDLIASHRSVTEPPVRARRSESFGRLMERSNQLPGGR